MAIGLLAAVVANALWGFTFLGPKLVEPIGIGYLVIARYGFLAILSTVVLSAKWKSLVVLSRKDVVFALHLGVVGGVGFAFFMFLSVSIGGGVLASLVTGVIPALVATAWNVRSSHTPWNRVVLPLGSIIIGLIILNVRHVNTDATNHSNQDILLGTLFALIASLAWVYFVVTNAVYLRSAQVVITNNIWSALIGVGTGFGSLLLIPLVAVLPGTSPFQSLPVCSSFLGWSAVLALFGSWFPTYFWTIASKRLPTILTAQLIALETLFGAMFNLIWDGRYPSMTEVIGGALIFGGVFICVALYDDHSNAKKEPKVG